MILSNAFVRAIVRVLGAVVVLGAIAPGEVHAQVTPFSGAIVGAEGGTRERTADDILRDVTTRHFDSVHASLFQPGLTTYALGRVRSTSHDGYSSTAVGKTVSFDEDEWSVFGAAAYRGTGLQADSRYSIGAYLGFTSISMALGPQPDFYGALRRTGEANNDALLGGISAVYSIGNLYFAGTATAYSGETDANQTTGGPATLGTKFDTSGYMVNAALGNSIEVGRVGGARTFLTGEVGIRHIGMETDKFRNRGNSAVFDLDYGSTVGSVTVGAFAVVPMGSATARPFARAGLLHDFDHRNEQVITDPVDGSLLDVSSFGRDGTTVQTEVGVGIVQGQMNYSASAFGEWSGDHETLGMKLGVRYDF